ncbi:MAG: T9SS type A sorting domain-containing protein, partial [Bacteroidota bacterium]
VFVGLSNGRVFRLDNAHTNNPTATRLNPSGGGGPAGSISCIAYENGNDNHLLVTASNYGIISVWETFDGGSNWFNREGDLPDFPVRWAMFNPNDPRQAVLATELGVWVTESLDDATVQWIPSSNGMPNTRVSMLQTRSDQTILAGTHGRGFFTTNSLELPAVSFLQDQVFTKENSGGGRIDDCNGYREVEVKLVLNSPPAASVPVVLEINPSSTASADDFLLLPSNIVILPEGVTDTQTVSLQIINDGKVEAIENLQIEMQFPIPGFVSGGANTRLDVNIVDGLTVFNQIASNAGARDLHPLGPNETIYFYRGNEQIIGKLENLSAHDFGCISMEIDREGDGTVDFWDDRSDANDLAAKTYFISADNPSDNAPVRLSLYYSNAEIDGWETATGKDFQSEVEAIRSPGAISNITPDNLTPDGPIERIAPAFETVLGGGGQIVTIELNGQFGGFGFGAPAEVITLSGNDLTFDGEALSESNRLFWEIGGQQDWQTYEVEKLMTDGTTKPIATVAATSSTSYEAFDLEPEIGDNTYQLRLTTADGSFAVSNQVTLTWEESSRQLGPVAPNPFTTFLDLFPGDENVSYSVRLIDLKGSVVAEAEFVSGDPFRWELGERNLSPGLYILETRAGDNEPSFYKLFKQ